MSIPSEYRLYHTLTGMGFAPDRASLATDVLLGRRDDEAGPDADETADWPTGPGESWPCWTREERWTITEPGTFEPSPEDEEWVAGLPSDEDLEAMARHAAWLDHLEGLTMMTDQDIIAAGLAAG